jgi:hypothetical protein
MATKIYVSQIDTANSTGGQAPLNSIILVGSNGPYWSNTSIEDLLGIHLNEIVGYTGSAGYQGSAGTGGYAGSVGFQGSVGVDGPQGAVGYQGSVGAGGPGYTGSTGDQGPVGYQGSLGSVGYSGSVGDQGPIGGTGYLGSVGFQGSVGYQGSTGGPGTIAFNQLTDTPSSYSGKASNFVKVNATANGLVFDSNTYITNNVTTGINFSSNTIYNPSFQNYSEVIKNTGNSTSVVSVDVRDGNVNKITLNSSIVQIIMSTDGLVNGRLYSITLMLKQDSSGTRTVDWSLVNVVWPAGEGIYSPNGPTLSTQANYTDFVTLMTTDAGTTWYGVLSAKGFPTT